MKISVAMATYNGAKYIQEQLDSFVNQTHLPDELIVVDDVSTDNTVDIIKAFAENVPFDVKWYINEKNLGYAGNFNAALSKTTGDLVFLSDQDDVWHIDKINYIKNISLKNKDKMVFMNDAILVDENLILSGLTKLQQVKRAGLSNKSFVMGACAAFRREYLNILLPIYEGVKSHDNYLVGIADAIGVKMICDKPLQYYRRHGNNESQAVYNKLSPIGPLDLYGTILRNVFIRSMSDKQYCLEQHIKSLESSISSYPGRYRDDLMKCLKDLKRDKMNYEKRLLIRSRPLPQRIFAIMKMIFLQNGERKYKFVNCMRDVLG